MRMHKAEGLGGMAVRLCGREGQSKAMGADPRKALITAATRLPLTGAFGHLYHINMLAAWLNA